MALLEDPLSRHPEACVWLLKYLVSSDSTKLLLQEILLTMDKGQVRESFSKLLKTAIRWTAMNEQAYFFETIEYVHFEREEYLDEEKKTESRVKKVTKFARQSAVARFIEYFFAPEMMGKEVRTQWRQYEEYFDVLSDYV